MAWKVKWTNKARNEWVEILNFWITHTQSNSFSKKLNKLLRQNIKTISQYPYIGKQTNQTQVFIKIVKHYLVYYEVLEDSILILTILDSRRDIESLN